MISMRKYIHHLRQALLLRSIGQAVFLLLLPAGAMAQLDWQNYSTSFQGDGKEGKRPVLVTAIPYNGLYSGASYFSSSPAALHLADTFYASGEKRPRYIGESNTIDSAEVYFLAAGVHPENAARYEFRVILDGKQVILPWSPVTRFTDPDGRALNDFKPNYGFLGGYKTTWGHFLLVDIREKATKTILSTAVVYWRSAHPTLGGVFTAQNLRDFVGSKRESWNWKPDSAMQRRLGQMSRSKLLLSPGDNTLIFYVNAEIYQRQALEYRLLRDGSVDIDWKSNDFDNNLIYLNDLRPGDYMLQMRLRAQRHNVSSFPFLIQTAWYETKLFKFALGALQAMSLGAIVLLFTLFRQRRKTRREQATREKLNLELGYIRSQLNPHFIFNSLSSIQGLVNRNEISAANRYLLEFGSLLRDSLAVSDKYLTELSREVDILDSYLQLEQLRFGFRYEIRTPPDLSPAETEIPAFLLQPIIENAVKHGVSALHEAGLIQIVFSRENGNFIAQVTDNGKGWDTGVRATGYGLRLSTERIRLHNELLKDRPIRMTINSTPGGGGTMVHLEFNNWWS
jgi:two-component system LytT family sensor kinase